MTLDFGAMLKACAIAQYDFIKKLHCSLPDELKGPYRATPAPENLFKINPNAELASKEKSNKYYEITAKSLWVN